MKRIGRLAMLAALIFLPGVAEARGSRGGGGTVTTPYGTANINSPEWKQSGGDFRVYQSIMQQKQLMLQQRALLRQRQAFLKQQQKGENVQPSSSAAPRPAAASKTRKKRPTRKANPASVSSQKAGSKSETTKP